MAQDLVTERHRVLVLQRENRELRAQLEEYQRLMAEMPEAQSGAARD